MRQELDPSQIVQTSDFNGFAGLRVVIRQKAKDGSYGSGSRGTSFFGSAIGLEKSVGAPSFDFQQSRPVKSG
jgi:hypothetical protein